MADEGIAQTDASTPGAAGEHDAYRALSPWAILALLLGLASPLALMGPVLRTVPLLGVIVAILALRQIATGEGRIAGRGAAVLGLALSLLFGSAAISQALSRTFWIDQQSRELSRAWIDFLLDGQPQMAHQLTKYPSERVPLDDMLWTYYRRTPAEAGELRAFVSQPLVHALLELADKATVRHWEMESIVDHRGKEYVVQIYTVTYEDRGQRTTFFARVFASRRIDPETEQIEWRIEADDSKAGIRPHSLGAGTPRL
ncbi:MAG: hypothetical protein WDZ59_16685 [Pirellulales bacterium]